MAYTGKSYWNGWCEDTPPFQETSILWYVLSCYLCFVPRFAFLRTWTNPSSTTIQILPAPGLVNVPTFGDFFHITKIKYLEMKSNSCVILYLLYPLFSFTKTNIWNIWRFIFSPVGWCLAQKTNPQPLLARKNWRLRRCSSRSETSPRIPTAAAANRRRANSPSFWPPNPVSDERTNSIIFPETGFHHFQV